MPVFVAAAIGVGVGYGAAYVGASVVGATIIGTGVAIAAHETGVADDVYDGIVKPVVDGVGDILKSDLGQAVLKIAALSVGAPPWVVPLISGAGELADGGDLGDALKAAAISYAAQGFSEVAGELAGDAVLSATGNAAVATFVGAGTGQAAKAIVYGQDPVQAFLTGGVATAMPAIRGYVDEQTDGLFSELPEVAQNVLDTSFSKILTGEDVTPEAIMNAVLSAESVTNAVSGFFEDATGYSEGEIAAITSAVQRTASAAFGGGDIEATLANQLNSYANKEFKNWFNTTGAGVQITQTMDKITGDYQRVQAKAEEMDTLSKNYDALTGRYREIVESLGADGETLTSLATEYQRALQNFQANESSENTAALEAAYNAYTNFENTFDTKYPDLKAEMDNIANMLPGLEETFSKLGEEYDVLTADLTTSVELADDELRPLYEELDKNFVEFMDPNFDETAYRSIAGLDSDEDAYYHWLTEGKEANLPTNQAAFEEEFDARFSGVANNTLAYLGVDPTRVTPQQMRELTALISSQVGTDIDRLRNMGYVEIAEEFVRTAAGGQVQDIGTYFSLKDELAAGAEIPIDANSRAFLTKYGVDLTDVVDGEYIIQEDLDIVDENLGSTLLKQTRSEPVKAEGVTDEDIANGNAKLSIRSDGLLEWGKIELNAPYWSKEFNRLVRRAYYTEGFRANEGAYEIVDAFTNEQLTDGSALRIEISTANLIGYNELKDSDPGMWAQIGAGLDDAAQAVMATQVGQDVVDFINKYDDAGYFDTARDYGGLVAKAGGELLGTMDAFVSITLGFDPNSSSVGAFADDVIQFGEGLQTDEWQEALSRIDDKLAEGEGWERVGNIWGAFQEAPEQFVAEIIGNEIIQELPWLLASKGTMTGARATFQAMGKELSDQAALRVGIGTSSALDLAESFGGAADSAYNEALSTYLSVGMSEEEAKAAAMELAQSAGLISATVTLASFGLGGNDFEKAFLGKDTAGTTASAFNWLKDKIVEGTSVSISEGKQEFIEEGLPTLFVETVLAQVDPNRDVLGNVAQAAALGAVAGFGTAGGIYTGDTFADLVIRTSPEANAILDNVKNGAITADVAATQLEGLGITEQVSVNNLLSTVDNNYNSTGQVLNALAQHPGFATTDEELLNLTLNSAGEDVVTYVNTYVGSRYLSPTEVKAYAEAEGLELTDEEIMERVGRVEDKTAETEYLVAQFDNMNVTGDEARAAFEAAGYNALDNELEQFIGRRDESLLGGDIDTYIDPYLNSAAEVEELFSALGYNPTAEEITQFTGQIGLDEENTVNKDILEYIDPLQTTEAEVRAAFELEGYEGTDEDFARFVGQFNQDEQTAAARTYADENVFSEDEALEALTNAGFTDLYDAAALGSFLGQQNESDAMTALLADAQRIQDDIDAANAAAAQAAAAAAEEAERLRLEQEAAEAAAEAERLRLEQEAAEAAAAEAERLRLEQEAAAAAAEEAERLRLEQEAAAAAEAAAQAAAEAERIRLEQEAAAQAAAAAEAAAQAAAEAERIRLEQEAAAAAAAEAERIRLEQEAAAAAEAERLRLEQEAAAAAEAAQANIDAIYDSLTTEQKIAITNDQLTALAEGTTTVEALFGTDTGGDTTLDGTDTGGDTTLDIDAIYDSLTTEQKIAITNDQLTALAEGDITVDELFGTDTGGDTTLDGTDTGGDTTLDGTDTGGDTTLDGTDTGGDTTLDGTDTGGDTTLDGDTVIDEVIDETVDETVDPYAEVLAQIAENQQIIQNQQIQQQIQIQQEIERRKRAEFRDLLLRQQDLFGQQVDVETPDPGDIEYFYGFDTIFATPEQATMYPSPFAKGGQVGDLTDKILLIIGDD